MALGVQSTDLAQCSRKNRRYVVYEGWLGLSDHSPMGLGRGGDVSARHLAACVVSKVIQRLVATGARNTPIVPLYVAGYTRPVNSLTITAHDDSVRIEVPPRSDRQGCAMRNSALGPRLRLRSSNRFPGGLVAPPGAPMRRIFLDRWEASQGRETSGGGLFFPGDTYPEGGEPNVIRVQPSI